MSDVPSSGNPLWPSREDPRSSEAAILAGVFVAGTAVVSLLLIALLRGGTGVLSEYSTISMIGVASAFAVLGYGVQKKSRIAALLLCVACFAGSIVFGLPNVVSILATLFSIGAARGTFLLRPNNKLQRKRGVASERADG